jgi:long-chain acyl-CoA synthetase
VGLPIPDVQIQIDVHGELWVRGPGVFQGYWGDPEATQQRLQDGWLRTGDLARLESDGVVRILGRCDDVLVLANGRKILASSIERRLMEHPRVEQCLLTLDKEGQLLALVYPPCGDPELLLHWFREQLAEVEPYAWPTRIRWMDEPCTVENGRATSKGNLKRSAIERWLCSQPAFANHRDTETQR